MAATAVVGAAVVGATVVGAAPADGTPTPASAIQARTVAPAIKRRRVHVVIAYSPESRPLAGRLCGVDRPFRTRLKVIGGPSWASVLNDRPEAPIDQVRLALHRLIDQVNEASEPLTITGQRGNAVLVGEEDWRAIQETLYLQSAPGMTESIRAARREGIESGADELDW